MSRRKHKLKQAFATADQITQATQTIPEAIETHTADGCVDETAQGEHPEKNTSIAREAPILQADVAKIEILANVSTQLFAVPIQKWFAMDEAVVGLAHRVVNMPCQDATRATNENRPCMLLADGAGSSVVSEIGARAVVTGLSRLVQTLNPILVKHLDEGEARPEPLRNLGLMFVKHAAGLLDDLAHEHRRERRDFRSTLLLCITGHKHHLWLKVGDGVLVAERQLLVDGDNNASLLEVLGHAGKGEFANETQFLDTVKADDVQIGHLSAAEITGLVLMSDGAAERLVSHDGLKVSKRLSTLLEQLRQEKLKRSNLTRMFYEDGFCERSTGDDRAITLLASKFSTPNHLSK